VLLVLLFRRHYDPVVDPNSRMLPVPNADNLTTFISHFLEIWESQHPENLRACTGIAVLLGCGKTAVQNFDM
jgi:hypothetical protein